MAVVEIAADDEDAFKPITTWVGWRDYVDSPPLSLEPAADSSRWTAEQQLDHHSQFVVMTTPVMTKVSRELQLLLHINRRQRGTARRGLIVSGPPSTGKTTTMMELGRIFELADRRKHPDASVRLPVAFVSVPPASTPKMLVAEFARFLGLPLLRRMNQAEITDLVCAKLSELRTQLVLVDDIHLLDTRTRAGAETSDQIKHLGERIAATFVFAGVDVQDSPLLVGPRGQQIAGRFQLLRNDPLPYGAESQKQVWLELVTDLESALRLHDHRRGTLPRLAAYLHRRTGGVMGTLVSLIRKAAMAAILDGSQRITKESLEQCELDLRAEEQLLAPTVPKPRRSLARPTRSRQ
jgi:hypothetical protein